MGEAQKKRFSMKQAPLRGRPRPRLGRRLQHESWLKNLTHLFVGISWVSALLGLRLLALCE
jgi:hypothetical protein